MTDGLTQPRTYLRAPSYGCRSTKEKNVKYNKLNLTTEEYERQTKTRCNIMTWDTEYDEAIAYSSRITVTTEEHDIK
jgi:hypothetical protein